MVGKRDETPVVHIVDDDESMCAVLDSLLRSAGLQAQTYGSAREFLAADKPDRPGCILLDVRLPGTSGLDFHTRLAGLGIHLPVILITGYADVPMSVRAMKDGAVDFLTKPFRDQELLHAVTAAIDRDQKRRADPINTTRVVEHFATLTPREQQVMTLVASGKLNKQVAGELGLSEVTVKIHRASAMRKMSARSLADLVRMADALQARKADRVFLIPAHASRGHARLTS